MNVTKKSVKEEWVWQSESLDLVCLYIYIYIYIYIRILKYKYKDIKDSQIELWNHVTKYIKERFYQ